MAKIILIEDDQQLSGVIKTYLTFNKHTADALITGVGASDHLKIYPYDLIILDWDLPGESGIEILRTYRERGGSAPVLMLTGKGKIEEKERGFGAGADDYLSKPFDMRELGMRVSALLRRGSVEPSDVLRVGKLELNTSTRKVYLDSEPIELRPLEFALLEFFLRHPNEVFVSEALLNRVWTSESEATGDALRSVIKRLRQKIDADGAIIKNVHGVGYVLESK